MSGVRKLKFSRLLDAGTMTPGAPSGFGASWRKHRGNGAEARGKGELCGSTEKAGKGVRGEMESVIRFEEVDSRGSKAGPASLSTVAPPSSKRAKSL